MKKHTLKDNYKLLYGWEKVPSTSTLERIEHPGGVTIGKPTTEPKKRDGKDPAGLWNPPITK